MSVICLQIKKTYLENYCNNNVFQNRNDAIFTCCSFSILVIWNEYFMVLFYYFLYLSYNTIAFSGWKWQSSSSENLFCELCYNCFFESSSNISLESQYDQKYINIEIAKETETEVLQRLQSKRKSLYISNFHSEQTTQVLTKSRKKFNKKRNQIFKIAL